MEEEEYNSENLGSSGDDMDHNDPEQLPPLETPGVLLKRIKLSHTL